MKIILIIFLSFSFSFSFSQNLVPNPSFEDTLHCPIGFGDLSAAKFWYKPNQGSSDYFNICYTGDLGVPANLLGYQNAMTGNAYAGWGVIYDSLIDLNYREYLQVQLTSILTAGKKYFISAYFAKADSAPIVLKNFGMALSDTLIGGNYSTTISFTPQIIYSQFLTDTDWTEISDTIIANGNEKYLTIGYFKNNNTSDTMSLFVGSENYDKIAYYYVDEVSVIEDTAIGIDQHTLEQSVKIYSNNGIVTIKVTISLEVKIEIYNLLGQMINNKTISPFSDCVFNLSAQPAGIYLFKLNSAETITTKKIFIPQ